MPIDTIGQFYNAVLDEEIEYGPANSNVTRKMSKKMQLECINDQCTMLYIKDDDVSL